MRKPGSSLARGLDKEVYTAICKILDSNETIDGPHRLSVDGVYSHLKKCNSSLNRKSKVLLEDSIARILEVLREEHGAPDSADEVYTSEEDALEAQKTKDLSNAMNRRLTQSWSLPTASPRRMEEKADSTGDASRANSQQSKKRPPSSTQASEDVQPQSSQKQHNRASKRTKPNAAESTRPAPRVTLADIGGMDEQIRRLNKLLIFPFFHPQRFQARGLGIPRGILLHGPPGCGKTMLCEAIAHELGAPLISISAPSVVSGMSGESEKTLREHFENARRMAPAIIFIDEIDAITPKRESAQREMERRIVSQLLTCMDDIAPEKNDGKPVIVLAATNRPDSLDLALRRGGRFDMEIELGVPDVKARERILRKLTAKLPLASEVDFEMLAYATPGFVGADLSSLATQAVGPMDERYLAQLQRLSTERWLQKHDDGQQREQDVIMADHSAAPEPVLSSVDEQLVTPSLSAAEQLSALVDLLKTREADLEPMADDHVTMDDFLQAIHNVQASSTREGFATIPNVPWDTIGAYHETRQLLMDTVVKPIQNPAAYARFNMSPPGVLLYGPPGCGKTLLASAVASSCRANFISVKGPELLNKYVGESEKAVRQLFARARYSQPVVVFFDELDALVPRRDDAKSEASNRVVNAMLAELDGIASKGEVYVIAATNRKDVIDPAMLRHGRLGSHIYVGLPGPDERVEVLETILRRQPLGTEGEESLEKLKMFAVTCDRFSGADLRSLVYKASLSAINRGSEVLEMRDLVEGKEKLGSGV